MAKKLDPDKLTALVDTREQTPWDLTPMKTATASLKIGDYSVKGLENYLAIERKNWMDFLQCCGNERERFENCILRMKGIPYRAIVVEGRWSDVVAGNFGRSRLNPKSAYKSVVSWQRQGIHVFFAESPALSALWAREYMHSVARKIHDTSTVFAKAMVDDA